MRDCGFEIEDPFRCPEKYELWLATLALLPPGGAWQNTEDAPVVAYDADEAAMRADMSVLQRYWYAHAGVLEALHQRACALIDEFFCYSANEMRPEWRTEFAIGRDPCEPINDACEKMQIVGGARCENLQAMAARAGFAITCVECTSAAVADLAVADCSALCDCEPNALHILISESGSPAVSAAKPMTADAAVADCTPPCPPVPDAIICLLEKFKPAHLAMTYEVVD